MPKKKTKRKRMQGKGTGIGNDINEAVKNDKLLIGSNMVFRNVKKGRLQSLIFASNLPEASRKELDNQASISGIERRDFEGDSAKLGEACGKPFNILLIGIKK